MVPGCETTWRSAIPEPESVHEVAAYLTALRDEATRLQAEHVDSHFLPEPSPDARGTTINGLTNVDGTPAYGLGPMVAAIILVTRSGMAQIIGQDDTDPKALALALINAADAIVRTVEAGQGGEDRG
jgi:hypothetical protein